MMSGARTPEELEALFEDAVLLGDRDVVVALFEPGAVLAGDGLHEARGAKRIAETVTAMRAEGRTYLADPRRVLQARDTALVLAGRGLSVMRRGGDGLWRYAICLVSLEQTTKEEAR
jgi:hypothetical protein